FRPGSMSTDSGAMLRSHKLLLHEAGMRHQQLPSRIFRWARAHQHLEFGFAYLGDRRFSRACWLLSRALWADPIGSSRWLMRRIVAQVERRRDNHVGIRRAHFFDADPTSF